MFCRFRSPKRLFACYTVSLQFCNGVLQFAFNLFLNPFAGHADNHEAQRKQKPDHVGKKVR